VKKLIILLLFLAACTRTIPVENGPPIETYFCERDNCTQLLSSLIANADDPKCALYDVSLPELMHTLKNIRYITEDGKPPLMHDKFCVLNKTVVWTGSWNPTRGKKANNAVIIHSQFLAQNYLEEYAELPGGKQRVRNPKIVYNNKTIENYFCPEDDCKKHIIEPLTKAKQSITFMLADLTDKDVLKQLQRTDISVHGIIDKAQKKAIAKLPDAKTGSIHDKVFIIDGETVITGSYNPTNNGDKYNDENVLILHDKDIASRFLEEYNYLIS
jgi:hypothetical protein